MEEQEVLAGVEQEEPVAVEQVLQDQQILVQVVEDLPISRQIPWAVPAALEW
jgi:hypothetical protein